jgi:Protein of unknown function (DUF2934)
VLATWQPPEEMLHMERSLEQQIRERAYEIWNASGREDGRAAEHWLSAELELLGTQAAAAENQNDAVQEVKGAPTARDAITLIFQRRKVSPSRYRRCSR